MIEMPFLLLFNDFFERFIAFGILIENKTIILHRLMSHCQPFS
jgi:hypothetical protein